MKVFSPLLDDPSQSPSPIVEDALELLKSDAIKNVCQCLDEFVWVLKTLVCMAVLARPKNQKWHGLR
jgi:hypothetical protein